jgi:hypothetical protein
MKKIRVCAISVIEFSITHYTNIDSERECTICQIVTVYKVSGMLNCRMLRDVSGEVIEILY